MSLILPRRGAHPVLPALRTGLDMWRCRLRTKDEEDTGDSDRLGRAAGRELGIRPVTRAAEMGAVVLDLDRKPRPAVGAIAGKPRSRSLPTSRRRGSGRPSMRLAPSAWPTVVLDTPPRSETAALEAAQGRADLVIVPCRRC